MSNTDFQNRIARLNEKHAQMPRPEDAAPISPPARSAVKRGAGTIVGEVLAIPFFFLVGIASVLIARMIMFHYVSDGGFYDATATGMLSGLLGDIGIDMALSGLVVCFLLIKNMWLPMLAHAAGGYLAMWREGDMMRMFPELWSQLYTPEYVAMTLIYLEQADLF